MPNKNMPASSARFFDFLELEPHPSLHGRDTQQQTVVAPAAPLPAPTKAAQIKLVALGQAPLIHLVACHSCLLCLLFSVVLTAPIFASRLSLSSVSTAVVAAPGGSRDWMPAELPPSKGLEGLGGLKSA